MSETKQKEIQEITNSLGSSGISRKDFLKYSGAAGAAVATLGLVGCSDDGGGEFGPGAVFLGTGDVGVLNYAYALEQLEAAFYIKAASQLQGYSQEQADIIKNLRDHEVAHREFFKAALSAVAPAAIIPPLTPDFSSIDFGNPTDVINTALTFENVGVSAYNGAASKLENKEYLLVAGKIVSVEARHAAAISDIALGDTVGVAQPGIINESGLGLAAPISEVLTAVNPFIVEIIDASGIT